MRYSSRDGHAGGEHVNRGRDAPHVSVLPYRYSICPHCCVCVLVFAKSISEVLEGFINYPVRKVSVRMIGQETIFLCFKTIAQLMLLLALQISNIFFSEYSRVSFYDGFTFSNIWL